MLINDLLYNKKYRGNQTELAKDLSINRGTFRRYMVDEKGEFHFIKKTGDNLELFANQSKKIAGSE